MVTDAFKPLDTEPIRRVSYRQNEAAEAMGLSVRKLQYLMGEDSTFPRVKLGSVVLIPIEPLRQWLAEQAEATKLAYMNTNTHQ